MDIDPDAGIAVLPESPADASDQVTEGCSSADGNRLVATGRGGIHINPTQAVASEHIWKSYSAASLNFIVTFHSDFTSTGISGAGILAYCNTIGITIWRIGT